MKKDVKSKVVAKKWLDGRLMKKEINNENSDEFGVSFCHYPTIKPFIGCHLGFHNFFYNVLFGGCTFFYSCAVLD